MHNGCETKIKIDGAGSWRFRNDFAGNSLCLVLIIVNHLIDIIVKRVF